MMCMYLIRRSFLEWFQLGCKIKFACTVEMIHLFVFFFVPHCLAQFDIRIITMENSFQVSFNIQIEYFWIR